MDTRKKIIATVAGLVGLSTIAAGISQIPATAQVTLTPVPGQRLPFRQVSNERHPRIVQAIRHLEAAKDSLQHAKHDFGGHRERALDLTQQAISECQLALQSDKH